EQLGLGVGHCLMVGHRDMAATVQPTIEFPQVPFVLLAGHDVPRTTQCFPLKRFVEQTRHLTGTEVEALPLMFVLNRVAILGLARTRALASSRFPRDNSISCVTQRRDLVHNESELGSL